MPPLSSLLSPLSSLLSSLLSPLSSLSLSPFRRPTADVRTCGERVPQVAFSGTSEEIKGLSVNPQTLSIHLSIYLSIHLLSIYLCLCLSVYPSIFYLSLDRSLYLYLSLLCSATLLSHRTGWADQVPGNWRLFGVSRHQHVWCVKRGEVGCSV